MMVGVRTERPRCHLRAALWVAVVCLAGTLRMVGQAGVESPVPQVASAVLPDAPGVAGAPASVQPGVLRGTIVDGDGALVSGARVTLTGAGAPHVAISDEDGRFVFAGLAAGSYELTVTTAGLAEAHAAAVLRAGEGLEMPAIVLSVDAAHTDVDVTVNRHDQVELEVKQEETQRILGLVPNYFVTYDWNAKPLSAGQKYELAWRTTIDPVSFGFSAVTAGAQQATNSFSGYGQGAQGYGKRLGAAYADFGIGTMLGGAVLPSLLRQDPRYFFKGTGGTKARALYAFASAYVCRGDNGRRQPNYSSVIGDVAAGAASNLYYPKTDQSAWDLVLENGLLGTVFDGLGNVVQEFVFSRFTSNAKKAKP